MGVESLLVMEREETWMYGLHVAISIGGHKGFCGLKPWGS